MTRDSNEVLTRPRDVSFAIDQASAWNHSHPLLKNKLDLSHVGVLGHSFGAYTTLAACGARPVLDWLTPRVGTGKGLGPDLSDKRISACVALSPQGPGEPYFNESSYTGLNRPVLGISGTRDKAQNKTPENRKRFFELEPKKGKIFIWIKGADHLSFADSTGSVTRNMRSRSRKYVQPIVRVATLLFFKTYLQNNKTASALLTEKSFSPLIAGVVKKIEIFKK
jgi:predicted dienelactone hydrolase